MAKIGIVFASHILLLYAILAIKSDCLEKEIYVVYMGASSTGYAANGLNHHTMLTNILQSSELAKESLVYSYGRSFNGFAARLSSDQARSISEMQQVVSVMPNRILQLHTTRSWDFTGLSKENYRGSNQGDVIVGIIDTGIWPESESFRDEGFTAPPSKWKGTCQAINFTCNNKLIGARVYASFGADTAPGFGTPRDYIGHGTHTASTAAGAEVKGASYLSLAKGVARGGVPNARIAMYKVCSLLGCSVADILAAFDDAIADGVDIISVSLGQYQPLPYFEDVIAIGSFHAMKNGILTSNSAGNSGPKPGSVANYAPWSFTVAASTIDRKFVSKVVLGNGRVYTGLSINSFELDGQSFPLVWGGDAANYSAGADSDIARFCQPGALNSYKVQGKIVLCDVLGDGSGVLTANGAGTIMVDTSRDYAFSYPLPATLITTEDGLAILNYIRSTENPIASIMMGETWEDPMAARVASFSSRGPNLISPDILKPDITAPGVDILAAWSPIAPPSIYREDTRSVKFNIISGTSMSCPHVTGAAAYVKSVNPTWSPAAIKSALMTTATIMDSRKHPDLEFAYGAGHINPAKAINPGLVYNASETDYVNFLCKQGYNSTTLRLVTGDNSTCDGTQLGRALDLNYPTFALSVLDGQPIDGTFTRTVTNVGTPNSTYTVTTTMPELINTIIEPSVLSFSEVGETKTFTVKLLGPNIAQQPIMSGDISWTDGIHVVRSPVVVYNIIPGGFSQYSATTQKWTGSNL